jgi:gliding motility-associated-like protein
VYPKQISTITGLNTICLGETIDLNAMGTLENLWLNTNQKESKISVAPIENIIYTFVGTNLHLCRDSIYFPITVNKVNVGTEKIISAAQNGLICADRNIIDTLLAPESPNFDYKWSVFGINRVFGNTNFVYVNRVGTYKLTISDENKCKLSDSILVQNKCKVDTIIDTIPKEQAFEIHNLFTPNNDGVNEYFEISNLQPFSKVEIYNRWGVLVFNSDNYNNRWDAAGLSDGLYYYTFQSSTIKRNGWVQISR